MPDKIYKKGCGPGCVGCWRNRLKHGNPETKRYLKKNKLNEEWVVKDEKIGEQQHTVTLKIEAALSDLIGVVKRTIKENQNDLHIEHQHLFFNNVKLSNNRTLKYYKIHSDCVLEMVYKNEDVRQCYNIKLLV